MKVILSILLTMLFFVGTSNAYDVEMAKKFNSLFSQMTPEVIAKRPCEIDSK